jgi:hypothetical protein
MRILTLFLALFLTLLPENVPFESYSQTQDVCCEDVEDIEEEAVLKAVTREQRQPQESSRSSSQGKCLCHSDIMKHDPVILCFEKQWLTFCRLRL